MKIFIFGGTTEGRRIAEDYVKKGDQVTVSVATEIGAEELSDIAGSKKPESEFEILVGRLNVEEMERAIAGFEVVVDATHPYAKEASMNIKAACANRGILYQRIERDVVYSGTPPKKIRYFDSHREAAKYLKKKSGNILLTTGSKNLGDYTDILFDEADIDTEAGEIKKRLYVRVLPTCEAIGACEDCGIPHSHIIGMHGPFSAELNIALMHEYNIAFLVTKESGAVGGFPEKVQAATVTSAELVVVRS